MAKYEQSMEGMLDVFLFETNELLEKLDEILIRTESDTLGEEDVGEIFRIMHTVKGSAAMMGLHNVSKLAHSLEDLFSIIREDPNVQFDKPALYELLYAGSDGMKNEIENLSDESVPLTDFTEQIAKNRAFAAAMKGEAPAAEAAPQQSAGEADGVFTAEDGEDVLAFRVMYQSSCLMPSIRAMVLLKHLKAVCELVSTIPADLDADSAGDEISAKGLVIKVKAASPEAVLEKLKNSINVENAVQIQRQAKKAEPAPTHAPSSQTVQPTQPARSQQAAKPSAPAPSAAAKKHDDKSGAMISVKLEKLDRLMTLATEIVIAESGVLHSRDLLPYRSEIPNFYKSARELKKLTDELQDVVMSVRMVPVNTVFSKMNRVVRDMNKKLGKNVTLVIEGEDTEVDKSAADLLGDPLMHLVRNAVDHGIESPEERAAAGKTEPPTVTLSARYESNDALIEVRDNGAGMDPQKLLEKARSKGMLEKPEQEYTRRECLELIMKAGFSTNTEVTEFSGRGVGMDVVRKNLEKVGGALLVDSELGKGSVFTIRVPMSLSISDCMVIQLGGREYAVPVSAIKEIFRPKAEQLNVTPDGRETVLSDKLFRMIRLSEHFGLEGCESDPQGGIILLCTAESGEAALMADGILEEMQIAIKPFSAYLSKFGLKEAGFSGTSVLGDGSIIPVLDVNEIIKKVSRK